MDLMSELEGYEHGTKLKTTDLHTLVASNLLVSPIL